MKTWIRRSLIAVIGIFGLTAVVAGVTGCGFRDRGHHAATAEDIAQWRAKAIDRADRELVLDDAQKQRLGVLFDTLAAQRSTLMAGTMPREGRQPRRGEDQCAARWQPAGHRGHGRLLRQPESGAAGQGARVPRQAGRSGSRLSSCSQQRGVSTRPMTWQHPWHAPYPADR
jgi:hypothetical protein